MTTKALFFDIDGTLVSFNTHEIPASTVDALEQAKANGLKVFIATGRPRQLINNLSAISHLIDGYVTTTAHTAMPATTTSFAIPSRRPTPCRSRRKQTAWARCRLW